MNSGCVASTSSPASESAEAPATSINPDFYPIYETVAGLGVPVMVYTSPFAGPDPYLVNDMAPYERVLRQFPNLTLILGHGGYPRVQHVLDACCPTPKSLRVPRRVHLLARRASVPPCH